VLLPGDPEFPEILTRIPDMPLVLFAAGDLSLLGRPAVAIVGSRDHSGYGEEVADRVGRAAGAAGIVVVSGMARGLDAVAHSAALDVGGSSIGVLGNGLGVIYPAANRRLYERMQRDGLLLTEFPPGERPVAGSFPRRNRLISGLARVTVVVEAAEGSGTLITVGTALEQGRDVMAVPGPITSRTSVGTNRLIRDGAEPLLEMTDLLAHYPECGGGVAPEAAPGTSFTRETRPLPIPDDLPAAEHRLALALRTGPQDFDGLIRLAGLPAAEALAALSALELRGLVRQGAGRVEWGRN
jgi:DNA processing protein